MKKMLILILVTVIFSTAWAASIVDIWKSSEVAACDYMDKITLIDLNSGDEAVLMEDSAILDLCFDKTGKKLYLLGSYSEAGARYEDPYTQVIKLYEMLLPSSEPILLSSFTVTPPVPDLDYSYASMYLNKNANLTLILTFSTDFPASSWTRTYDFATKKLSSYQKYTFPHFANTYKYKGQPEITTKPGKYFNKLRTDNYVERYDLYTKDADGEEYPITDIHKLNAFGYEVEPLYYSVSPDSTRILFSTVSRSYPTMGETYCLTLGDDSLVALSKDSILTHEFVPYWMKDNRLVYLYQGASSFDKTRPSINFIATDGSVTVLKDWDDFWLGPMNMVYRLEKN